MSKKLGLCLPWQYFFLTELSTQHIVNGIRTGLERKKFAVQSEEEPPAVQSEEEPPLQSEVEPPLQSEEEPPL